jgi:hypothetical protein
MDALYTDIVFRPLHTMWAVGGLTRIGRFMVQQSIVGGLATQMKLAHLLDDGVHGPLIKAREVEAPIIIVGPPRTGTTFLHRVRPRIYCVHS